ncbi:hypothetical protein N0V86_000504 [Didymella sp. IMI 355093]|nr:hypothetical protein N0V86_000504 [Didymella sp. IMI 355093]
MASVYEFEMSGVVNLLQYTVKIMAGLNYLSRLAEDVLKGKSIVREDGIEVDSTVPYTSPQTAEPEDTECDHDVSGQQEHSGAQKETQRHQEDRKKGKNARRRGGSKIATDTPTSAHSGQPTVSTSTIATTAPVAESVELSAASSITDDSARTADQVQPMIVGFYGISGAGKSHVLRQLSNTPLAMSFDFIDGSALIDNHFGLAAFKKLSPEEQIAKRAEVMSKLVEERRGTSKGIVVGGHLLFWGDETRPPHNVGIDADSETYTHIVYLQVDPTKLHIRRKNDKTRDRGAASTEHLKKWQALERISLRDVCYKRGIVFTTIAELAASPDTHVSNQFMDLLMNFLLNNEESNLAEVDIALDNVVAQDVDDTDTMLVLDADKTLAAEDTGSLFWKFMSRRKDDFDYMCNQAAVAVEMYPEMAALLGIEPYPIKLVTGENGEGFRVRDEEKPLIIPLMRDLKKFGDIDENHFKGKKTIILGNSVVKSGTSIVEYLVTLRQKLPEVKVVVIAGVVQEGAVKVVEEGTLGYHLRKDPDLTLVALRTSLRKFTGKGTTDTGHRLFNTTYLR